MTFEDYVLECIKNEEFMREYRRISWSRIWLTDSPITTMIDEATWYKDKLYKDLFDFIMEYIYIPTVLSSS